MSRKISLTIDNVPVEAAEGATVLDAARAYNIYIPTLCHSEHLSLFGACRLCLVEVEGTRRLLAACNTPVAEGMVVKTDTPKVNAIRKTLMELLLLEHPLDCLVCDKGGECDLQTLAFKLRVTDDRLGFHAPAEKALDETNYLIQRDIQKCILCGKCVRVCDEVRNIGALGYTKHGMISTVGYPAQKLSNCEFCGECLAVCPVGALSSKFSVFEARPWEMEAVQSVCPYCGCGCDYLLRCKNDKVVKVGTRLELGSNEGQLCVKGRFGYDFINHPTRLRHPLLKKDGAFVRVCWEEAIGYIAERLKKIKEGKGPRAIAGIASTRCTNEENYLFQKMMRVALGTNNIDNNARLEHAPSIVALQDTLGVPASTVSIEDIKAARTILVAGANPTSSHVIVGLAVKQAVRNNGANLIVADPARINLVPFAKSWLRITPGTDVALLNGMARIIIDENLADEEFLEKHTRGLEELQASLERFSPVRVAEICGIAEEELYKAARLFAESGQRAVIIYGGGVTQHEHGVDNVYGLLNLLLLTGSLGREGAGILPLRTSCNEQGACDMGALPDYLPGYAPLADAGARRRMEDAWGVNLPAEPGLTLMEMMDAACEGGLSAMYIVGENPLQVFPRKERVKKALQNLELLVVQDIFLTETAQLAHVVLPASSFAEKCGTFTNTERRIQKLDPAIKPVGDSKPDSRIIQMLAKVLGYKMDYRHAADIEKEISEVVSPYAGIRYNQMGEKGVQWPLDAEGEGQKHLTEYKLPLKFHPLEYKPRERDADRPYMLITGGLLFHHSAGTMSGKTKGLTYLSSEPELEVNPADAERLRVKDKDKVVVENCRAELTVRVKISDRLPAGAVFLPKHFNSAPVNLITGWKMEERSRTPAAKITWVKINRSV